MLHRYGKCTLSATMSSTPNTKTLQLVRDADADAVFRLGRSSYYKYRAARHVTRTTPCVAPLHRAHA